VNIQGRINAAEGLTLMAGHGGTDTHAVTVSGQVVVNGRVAGSAVNLGDLKSLTPLQDVDGVIDITTTEVCDMMMGGVFPATEDRFGAMIRARMPYVGACGALDMVNFGPPDTVPEKIADWV
jgi:hypothetical protein